MAKQPDPWERQIVRGAGRRYATDAVYGSKTLWLWKYE